MRGGTEGGDGVEALIADTLRASVLGDLSPVAIKELLVEALRSEVPAGKVLSVAGDEIRPTMVVAGLVRLFMVAADGRQITLAYARPGELIGLSEVVGTPSLVDVQALTDCVLVRFGLAAFQTMSAERPELVLAAFRQLVDRLTRVLVEVRSTTFGTLRQRVARHLLDLAAEQQTDGRRSLRTRQGRPALVAFATRQQLADAVGSVREPVTRAVGELARDGLVEIVRHGVVIVDPEALRAEGWSTV